MKRIALLLLTLCSVALVTNGQTSPVIGHVSHESVSIWVGFGSQQMKQMVLKHGTVVFPTQMEKKEVPGYRSAQYVFDDLEENKTYEIGYYGDYGFASTGRFVRTSSRSIDDFSFLVGSCALILKGTMHRIQPGKNIRIFTHMNEHIRDFMLWMGDNVYYMNDDLTSYGAMHQRNYQYRSENKALANLLSNQPNYAGWDDHDFGPNNSDASFPLKHDALKAFDHFWPNLNKSEDTDGNYYMFQHKDISVFVLDDRFFKGEDNGLFGKKQMTWLKQGLLESKSSFNFILSGTQQLNQLSAGEKWSDFKEEKEDFLEFVASKDIGGIIFLSGDLHHSELHKFEDDRIDYPLYDFTCSPLLSPPYKLTDPDRLNNPTRVPGTLYMRRNFGKISVSGPTNDRICFLEIFSKKGKKVWDYTIRQSELQPNK